MLAALPWPYESPLYHQRSSFVYDSLQNDLSLLGQRNPWENLHSLK